MLKQEPSFAPNITNGVYTQYYGTTETKTVVVTETEYDAEGKVVKVTVTETKTTTSPNQYQPWVTY